MIVDLVGVLCVCLYAVRVIALMLVVVCVVSLLFVWFVFDVCLLYCRVVVCCFCFVYGVCVRCVFVLFCVVFVIVLFCYVSVSVVCFRCFVYVALLLFLNCFCMGGLLSAVVL